MEIDNDRIDDAVLALLQLVLHEDVRATKAKSAVLTEAGLRQSERLHNEMFTTNDRK